MPAPTFIFGTQLGVNAILPPYSPSTCDGYQYQERFQEDMSFQVSLTSNADQRLRWQAGVYYLDIERYQAVSQLRDDGTNWPNPAGNVTRSIYNEFTDAMVNDTFDTQTIAMFGSISYDVTEALELSVALRYDSEKREVSNGVPSPAEALCLPI